MSDSNHSTDIPSEALAGVPVSVSLHENSKVNESPHTVAPTAPKSSPPLLGQEIKKTLLPEPPSLEPNRSSSRNQADAENDSEAETLISSPVKKREALKNANQRNTGRNNNGPRENGTRHERKKQEKNGTGVKNGVADAVEEQIDDKDSRQAVGGAEQNDDESDYLSDVLSVRSSLAASDVKTFSRPVQPEADDNQSQASEKQDETEGDALERNGHGINTRKRKHREPYMPSTMEPPRRRRRASDEGHAPTSEENGDSPSPQLRRHRRTVSTQSSWTDPNRSVNGANSITGTASVRQRRAATHFPVREPKSTKHSWDSDTSSETSQQHHLSRLTRNINRSTSTPGRPMGRDHKRHVNKYGFTRLAEACENGDLDTVKEWRVKDPEQLEQREFAGNTPLQVASLNGYPEIVSYLLAEDCNPHTANTDQDTPLIDAVENGHLEVVHLLLKAGVNPLRQNLKGQQALDVVTEETENAQEIRAALREAIEDWRSNDNGQQQQREHDPIQRPGPSKELHFLAYTSSNLLRLAAENDQAGILELLKSSVQVTNEIVAAAAKTGDTFTVSMLLAELMPKEAKKKPELPLLAVVGTSHFEMVKYLTGADGFNPTWRSRSNGMTWYELAEQRQGPNWQQEKALLKQLYDERTKSERLSSSPVSRRENGKRRRSPLRQADSDVEMDDADSNDHARSRRRLVSKKVMREASHRHRSVSSSDLDNDNSVSMASSKAGSPEASNPKPAAPRKVGRPRKSSAPPRSTDVRQKRLRSSSIRDGQTPFESTHVGRSVNAPEHNDTEDEQKIKIEAEAEAEAKAEANRKMELEAKVKAENLAEEKRRAEQLKKEEEEARRKEAERKAEEIRLQHQRRMAEERRVEEERKLQALPSALQHVLRLAGAAKKEKQRYIQRRFLPIQVVKRSDIGPLTDDEDKSDELWMMSYQAAAILTNSSAASLLGLQVDASDKQSTMTGVATIEASLEQRRAMLPCLQSSSLVHALGLDDTNMPSDDLAAELALAEKARLQLADDRSKFLSMTSLRWIRFMDFYNAATTPSSPDYPHLAGIDLDIRFDCCLDSTPFLTNIKTEDGSSSDSKVLNGTKWQQRIQDSIDDSANGGTNGKCDDNSLVVHRAGPGITTFTIVQD